MMMEGKYEIRKIG